MKEKFNISMKRLKGIIIMILSVCIYTACDSENGGRDIIWDITPVEFNIFITDSEGHDLLDSTYQGNLIKDLQVSYQGEEYPPITDQEYYEKTYGNTGTRAYMPIFYGLLLRQYWSHKTFTNGDFEMIFGEFDGTENIDHREIILNLPNNQQIRLAYKNSFRWKSNGDPEKNTQFYLNGQELEDNAGRWGYYHFRYTNTGYEYIPSEIK